MRGAGRSSALNPGDLRAAESDRTHRLRSLAPDFHLSALTMSAATDTARLLGIVHDAQHKVCEIVSPMRAALQGDVPPGRWRCRLLLPIRRFWRCTPLALSSAMPLP